MLHSLKKGRGIPSTEVMSEPCPRRVHPKERCPLLNDWLYSGELGKSVLKIAGTPALEPLMFGHFQQVNERLRTYDYKPI